MPAIPKKVHLIWIGNNIPEKNRQCIETFPALNRDWEINLWIDENQLLVGERRKLVKSHYANKQSGLFQRGPAVTETTPKRWEKVRKRLGPDADDQATMRYLKKKFGVSSELLAEIRLAKLKSIVKFCLDKNIVLRTVQQDLTMGQTLTGIYVKELASRGSNFGAASDVLRIQILLQYGGVYFDTDVQCIHALGSIDCHAAHPRFSAVNPVWVGANANPPTRDNWNDNDWWRDTITVQDPPSISNSIIASMADCQGLKAYKQLIKDNYEKLANPQQHDLAISQNRYISDMRGITVEMTGPTAATKGSGFGTEWQGRGAGRLGANAQTIHDDKLYMRDNWYFPMYMVRDMYFHDWLH